MTVVQLSKLSDHASTIVRQRDAKACLIIVLESNGNVSLGKFISKAWPHEIQDALCAAITENEKDAERQLLP